MINNQNQEGDFFTFEYQVFYTIELSLQTIFSQP